MFVALPFPSPLFFRWRGPPFVAWTLDSTMRPPAPLTPMGTWWFIGAFLGAAIDVPVIDEAQLNPVCRPVIPAIGATLVGPLGIRCTERVCTCYRRSDGSTLSCLKALATSNTVMSTASVATIARTTSNRLSTASRNRGRAMRSGT